MSTLCNSIQIEIEYNIFIFLFWYGSDEFAKALYSVDWCEIWHNCWFQSPPPLIALKCYHFFFAQFAHKLRFCDAPHFPFMEIQESQHREWIVMFRLQMLPSAVILCGPMPSAFDFAFMPFKHCIMLAWCSWRHLEYFGHDLFAHRAKWFGV